MESPVQRRYCSHHRHVYQSQFFFQTADHFLYRSALRQHVKNKERGLQRLCTRPAVFRIFRKSPIIELASHKSLLIDPFIEDRTWFKKQSHPGTGVSRRTGERRSIRTVHSEIRCAPGEKGHPASLCQTVEIVVASPEVSAVLRTPRKSAASCLQGQSRVVICFTHKNLHSAAFQQAAISF